MRIPQACALALLLLAEPAIGQEQLANELLTRAEAAAKAREGERAAGLLRRLDALLPLVPPGPAEERLRAATATLLAKVDPSHRAAVAAREEAAKTLVAAAASLRAAGWPRNATRLAAQAYRLRPDLAGDLVAELRAATGVPDDLRVAGIPAPGVGVLAGQDSGLAQHFAGAVVPGVEHTWTLQPDEFTSPAGNDALILGAAFAAPSEIAVDLAFPAESQAAGIVFRYKHDDDFCFALAARHPDGGEYFKLLRHRDGRWEPLGKTQWIPDAAAEPWSRLRVAIGEGHASLQYRGQTSPPFALPDGDAAGIVGLSVIPTVKAIVPMRFRTFLAEGSR